MFARNQPKRLFFVNAWVDGLLIGGLSMVGLLCTKLASNAPLETLGLAAMYLTWVINWPHFAATSFRLYQSRDHLKQFPITAYVIPIILGGVVIAALNSPTGIAPYFVKIFTIWSPYHYAAQTLGIALIYAKRANISFSKLERASLSGFVFGTYLTTISAAEVGSGYRELLSVRYPVFGIPSWAPTVCAAYMYGSLALFVALAIRRGLKTNVWVGWQIMLAPLAQYVWFMNGDFQAFQIFVPMFHSLQYLLIAWSMQIANGPQAVLVEKRRRYLLKRSYKWGVINCAGGAILFAGLPEIFSLFNWPYVFANAILLTAVQVHHFFVDGVIWKIRPESGNSALTMNISEIFETRSIERTA